MSIDHRYQVDSQRRQATISTRSARVTLNRRHRLVRDMSRDINLLHKVVMNAHSGHLVEGADRVRERLKILYAAQRAELDYGSSVPIIRALLVQSQTQANWSELTQVGAATVEVDRAVRYTIEDGDTLFVRTWANPTRTRTDVRDSRGRRKRIPILDDTDAAHWIDRSMWSKGFDIDTRTLRVGEPRRLDGPGGLAITLRPYQFAGTVEDAKLMSEAIIDGIGRGRAYGAGLLHIQDV